MEGIVGILLEMTEGADLVTGDTSDSPTAHDMPTYTAVQKSAIQQFAAVADVKDSAAAKTLKAHNWNLDHALNALWMSASFRADRPGPMMLICDANCEWWMMDSYYNSNKSNKSGSNDAFTAQSLEKLFNHYRDIDKSEETNVIGVEGCMQYFADLGVDLEEPVVLVILTEFNAPTMGEVPRQGFVDYWKRLGAGDISAQKDHLPTLRTALVDRPETFKSTYKHTFKLALVPSQRSISLDTALPYWRLLLTAPSLSWNTPTTPWLDWFAEYLETRWKKGVSKDLWEQTGVFVMKSLEDEGMGWWSEDGAWPGVLDEFVGFVREKRGVAKKAEGAGGESMEL
ncbi:MAG: hypothetical protein LQ350_006641 [Teloschistes chrysophthalmus]|nr:MAG: hypothetical protein LQ350_006641 [Niorma chrysophthalma]